MDGAIEAVAAAHRQHPADAALVEARLDRDEQADDDDQEQAGDGAEDAGDRVGELPERPHHLLQYLLDLDAARNEAEARRPFERAVRLAGDDLLEISGLLGNLHARQRDRAGEEEIGRASWREGVWRDV